MASKYVIPFSTNSIDTSLEMSCDEEMGTHEINDVDLRGSAKNAYLKAKHAYTKRNFANHDEATQKHHMEQSRTAKKCTMSSRCFCITIKSIIKCIKKMRGIKRDKYLENYKSHGNIHGKQTSHQQGQQESKKKSGKHGASTGTDEDSGDNRDDMDAQYNEYVL